MKKLSIKFFDKIIVWLLGLGGIFIGDSCVEYGTRINCFRDFEIKGVVTDKVNDRPIQNIRVIRQIDTSSSNYGDTLYTNSEGKYSFKFEWSTCPDLETATFPLKIEDIDGEENGGYFNTKEIDVTFTRADWKKKEEKYEITQNIELDLEKKE